MCAIAATVALSILPAAHVHVADGGAPLVHQHPVNAPAGHGSALDHPDHHGVNTLEPVFVSERQYDVDHPLLTAASVLVAPAHRLIGRVDLTGDPVAHGPPIRIRSLRAPPA